jgi:hypothetical protein
VSLLAQQLGVAYAAKELGIACTIFVPKSIDHAKYEKNTHKKRSSDKPPISQIMAGNGGSLGTDLLKELPHI